MVPQYSSMADVEAMDVEKPESVPAVRPLYAWPQPCASVRTKLIDHQWPTPEWLQVEDDAEKPSKAGGKRFEIKKWNAVAMWSWAICTDTCAICRNNLYEPSIEYQANPNGESSLASDSR